MRIFFAAIIVAQVFFLSKSYCQSQEDSAFKREF